MDHHRAETHRGRPGRVENQIGRIRIDPVPSQQPRPAITLVQVVRPDGTVPAWPIDPVRAVPDATRGQERVQAVTALVSPMVER